MQNLSSTIISVNPGYITTGEKYLRAQALSIREILCEDTEFTTNSVEETLRSPMRAFFNAALKIGMRLRRR